MDCRRWLSEPALSEQATLTVRFITKHHSGAANVQETVPTFLSPGTKHIAHPNIRGNVSEHWKTNLFLQLRRVAGTTGLGNVL